MSDFQKRYQRIKEMGKGAYGKVEKAKEIATGKIVAIKTMNY